jgi:hypothetical protein
MTIQMRWRKTGFQGMNVFLFMCQFLIILELCVLVSFDLQSVSF